MITDFKPLDRFLLTYCTVPGKVLDVGGIGSKIEETLLSFGHQYESLNIGRGTYDISESPYKWNMIKDNTYDYTLSITAFEHIEFPWLTFLEMVRVTKTGGLIYIIAPSSGACHPNSLDCWRIFPDGMRAFAKWGNVKAVNVILNENDDSWNYCEGIFKKER